MNTASCIASIAVAATLASATTNVPVTITLGSGTVSISATTVTSAVSAVTTNAPAQSPATITPPVLVSMGTNTVGLTIPLVNVFRSLKDRTLDLGNRTETTPGSSEPSIPSIYFQSNIVGILGTCAPTNAAALTNLATLLRVQIPTNAEAMVRLLASIGIVSPTNATTTSNLTAFVAACPALLENDQKERAMQENRVQMQNQMQNQMDSQMKMQAFQRLMVDRTARSVLRAYQQQSAPGFTMPTNDVEALRLQIALGDWNSVRSFFTAMPLGVSTQLYTMLLRQLVQGNMQQQQQQEMEMRQMMERQQQQMDYYDGRQQQMPMQPSRPTTAWMIDDVIGLADAAPCDLNSEHMMMLGMLLRQAFDMSGAITACVQRLAAGTLRLGGSNPIRHRAAIELLLAAQSPSTAVALLPRLDAIMRSNDPAWASLWIKCIKDVPSDTLSASLTNDIRIFASWLLTNTVLTGEPRLQAMGDALAALPDADEVSLTLIASNPANALAVVAATAPSATMRTYGMPQPDSSLELDRSAADVIAASHIGRTGIYRSALNLIALRWLQKAQNVVGTPVTQDRTEYYRRYGYSPSYIEQMRQREQSSSGPDAADVLDARPAHAWLSMLDTGIAIRVHGATMRLMTRTEAYDQALDEVGHAAALDPDAGRKLSTDLLSDWSRTQNPNSANDEDQSYYYGYNPYGGSMSGTSLTRSRQMRNLVQLSRMLARFASMPGASPDTGTIVSAFCAAHSRAEVFRGDDITNVFGPFRSIPPDIAADLAGAMRQRLSRQWRDPQVQRFAKTNRNEKDIHAEVLHGYALITNILAHALATAPDNWRLLMLEGAIWFDWAEYEYGRDVPLALYTAKRDRAFAAFAKAAQRYAAALPTLAQSARNAEVYLLWFNATLGASDLATLARQQEPSLKRLDDIRATILALPAPYAAEHMKLFAAGLVNSARSIKPEFKARYLRAGIRVAGTEPRADEARKLVAYYDDLLNEIKLVLRLEGGPAVGSTQDFAAVLLIEHTPVIEREANGFGKYLQNQKTGMNMYYGYGDEAVNYRDNIEKYINDALGKTFDVKSITFHNQNVQSCPTAKDGWRETPLAYLQLKAKDAATDRIPPIQMDLDFYDKTGKVVLPIQSPPVIVDASGDDVPARPVSNLVVTLILDDREIAAGKLSLELRATGIGLIPSISQLFSPEMPGFAVANVSDSGTIVKEFSMVSNITAQSTCERNWLAQLTATDPGKVATSFTFPTSLLPDIKVEYKRYADADIVPVDASVALAGVAIGPSRAWRWWAAGGAIVVVICVAAWLVRRRHTVPVIADTVFRMPHHVNAFTVLALLQRILTDRGQSLSSADREALRQEIASMEQNYFSPASPPSTDDATLRAMASRWLSSAA